MDILKLLMVTAELTGTQLSEEAGLIMLSDIQQFEEKQIEKALKAIRINGLS